MDVQGLAGRIRETSYGPASAQAVERQVAAIARRLGELAADFGYDADDLTPPQAAALEDSYVAERTFPHVEADDIREIHEAHEPGAIPHNDDITVLAVDPELWEDYAIMSAGEAQRLGFRVLYHAARLAERLDGAELTDDLAERIAWEVTSEVAPG
ncbi:hypothetical protein ACQEU5_03665 [Marinactinospora thermotolerans]|uniref:Uncharacterized protein n=1 Tax=Marinactinospora thermotolerans DSM 45154 TaxID=1122192 RepID=A0A1T4TC97_9ACTN|nr:hypothetical protein [Marinactinospora thermotolerans]SKA38016.1 hypothetical protein SAMN02745673_04775 [Marinactinospora thermotolerans DSM 45154]